MKWTLLDVTQETNHPFLNFFTLHYDVEKEDGSHKRRTYFMASRKSKEELRLVAKEYDRPDGVVIALYYVDPETREVSTMITTQYRPPMGRYMTSVPAGMMDPEDQSLEDTARREAKEEAGVNITDIEVLSPGATTSCGMSDEMNAVVLARIESFASQELEEFEDIKANLVPLSKIKEMLKDPSYCIPLTTRLLMLYLIERFR